MEKALDLLNRDLIVRECAFELGYADEFYFSRDFKKYYGIPPASMRKKLLRKNPSDVSSLNDSAGRLPR